MSLDDADGGTQYFGPNAKLVYLPGKKPVRLDPEYANYLVKKVAGAWMEDAPDDVGSTTAAEVIRRTAEGLNLDPELMVGAYTYGQAPPPPPVPRRHEDTDPAVKALANRARQCIKDVGAIDREIVALTERIENLKAERQAYHATHVRCEEAIRILRTADQHKQPKQETKHP